MRLLAATLRRPAPVVGTLVALLLAAVLVTWTLSMAVTGDRAAVPPQRLAGTAAVVLCQPSVAVIAGSGDNRSTSSVSLAAYRRLPASVATELARLPGVATTVPDVSVPVALALPDGRVDAGTSAQPVTAYGWPSAELTPFRLVSGHPPSGPQQLVIGAGLARRSGLSPGERVRLAGQDLPPFEVVGVAAAPAGNPVQDDTVFFSQAEAVALAGHPGQADLIGVVARPGVPAALVAARVRAALQTPGAPHSADSFGGEHLSVLSGDQRGRAEDPMAPSQLASLFQLSVGAGIDTTLIALFVVAGAVALAVAARSRTNALLRAVGATPGQVRRRTLIELMVLGVAAGLVGVLPGMWLASWTMSGLAAHQIVPSTVRAWTSPWEILWSVAAGSVVAVVAGFVAARRAGRVSPVAALAESVTERRWPGALRLLLGVGALGGGVAAAIAALRQTSPDQQLNMALLVLLAFLVAVALLGPLLVILAEVLLRLPLRLAGRVSGRLASAEVRSRPRRMASAMVAVALTIAFAGGFFVVDATQIHADVVQGHQRLAATDVVTAPGPGLAPGALTAVAATPGVKTAIGVTPTTVLVPDPGANEAVAETVTPGPIGSVLDLGVVAGSLGGFGPGDIALSTLMAGQADLDVHVGQTVMTHLADGTPYRARVTAIYSRSQGFGDVLIPAGAGGGGHLGATDVSTVLVRGSADVAGPTLTAALGALGTRYRGLVVASRSVVNAQAERDDAQSSYLNNLLLGIIALLATVTLVNTLVVATLEQRESLLLLHRVGATARQVVSMVVWRTVTLGLLGLLLGVAAAAAAVLAVTKAVTGTWHPYLTWTPAVGATGVVLGLSVLAVLVPTTWVLRRR